MKQKLTLSFLALSLLFNLFVLIGFTQSRLQDEPSAAESKVVQQVTDELKLDNQQARVFADLHGDLRKRSAVFHDSVALVQYELMTELRKEAPDIDRVRMLVGKKAELDHQRRLAGADLYGEFVNVLSPQQRQALAGKIGPASRRGEPPPHLLRRFDANRNGRLDPEERLAAQRQLETHRKELRPRPFQPRPD